MPCLILHTNIFISDDKKDLLTNEFYNIINQVLSKPKNYIMVIINDQKTISFGESTDPAAFVELKSVGLPGDSPTELSKRVCDLIDSTINIDPDRVYIEFQDSPGSLWGWNSRTF